jgi:hypothetical protein
MSSRPRRPPGCRSAPRVGVAWECCLEQTSRPLVRSVHVAHSRRMETPTWADALAAWSTFATAVLTLMLVVLAIAAWRTAKSTLHASREASEAARASADAARVANEQAKIDSIAQTRPYVYVEIVPSLVGTQCWDIRIRNSGKSAARRLQLDYDAWPRELDKVAEEVKHLFRTPRTLPPGCQIRALWRLQGNFSDGTTEAGLGVDGTVTTSYTSDDPSMPRYNDKFEVMLFKSGYTPTPEGGPDPDGLRGDMRKFYLLGQALVRRVGELGR